MKIVKFIENISRSSIICFAQCIIAVYWTWVGAMKLFDISSFRETLQKHDVLSPQTIEIVTPVVPAGEVAIGFFMVVLGGRAGLSKIVTLFGVAAICIFSIYLMQVPADVLKKAGCGCTMRGPLSSGGTSGSAVIVRNTALPALHVALIALLLTTNKKSQPRPTDPPIG